MNKVHICKISLDRVFDLQHQILWRKRITAFGFESNGKRIFNVQIPGWRNIQSGMVLTVAMENQENWNRILGWKNENGQISLFIYPQYPLSFFALFVFFEIIFTIFKLPSEQYGSLHAITLILALTSFLIYLKKHREYKLVKKALISEKNNA